MSDRAKSGDATRRGRELEDVEDCEELAREVKCELQRIIERDKDTIVRVDVSVEELGRRERYPTKEAV